MEVSHDTEKMQIACWNFFRRASRHGDFRVRGRLGKHVITTSPGHGLCVAHLGHSAGKRHGAIHRDGNRRPCEHGGDLDGVVLDRTVWFSLADHYGERSRNDLHCSGNFAGERLNGDAYGDFHHRRDQGSLRSGYYSIGDHRFGLTQHGDIASGWQRAVYRDRYERPG